MRGTLSSFGLLATLALFTGCQSIQESQNLVPLPDNSPPQPYRDLVVRARFQASSANEFFYSNKWKELEETGKVLGQTANLVGKATGVPASREKAIMDATAQLAQQGINACMQQINSLVREMRIEP
jgi:hypothetical protein